MLKQPVKILSLMVMVLSLLIMSCGGTKSTTKEILLWSRATGIEGQKMKESIDLYNAMNPAYPIKFVNMEATVFNTRLITAGKSGKGLPDIALLASEALPTYLSQGILESWDDVIAGSELRKDRYVEAAWSAGHLVGSQYGIPSMIVSWLMYYNEDLVNLYVPEALDDGIITYEEIYLAGSKAEKDGIFSYANTWSFQNWSNIYMQLGGSWESSDGRIAVDNTYAYQAVEIMKELHDLGYMVPYGEDGNKAFLNGQLIFLPEGSWRLLNMEELEGVKWGMTFTPQWDAMHLVQGSGVEQFALFKQKEARSAEKEQGIIEFLTWLQANQIEWTRTGSNPTALAMLDNQEFIRMPQSFLLQTEQGRNAIAINTTNGMTFVFDEVDKRLWDMITGQADIEVTFKEIQKIVDEKVK